MKPTDPTPLFAPDLDLELDGFLAAFEAAAADGGDPDPSDFLPPKTHPRYRAVLREVVRVDLEFAWDRGEERRVEHYQDRFPDLFADPGGLREIAREEFRLRKAAGSTPDLMEYRARLGIDLLDPADDPHHNGSTGLFQLKWPADRTPEVGDTIPPGFELRDELGRGAFGRVFLARQADLAGRPVAVKISTRLAGESQTLARLQHTNIVPVYAVHRVGRFHAQVMPFLGRTTLADLIAAFRRSAAPPDSGVAIVSTLADRAASTGPAPVGPPVDRPPADVPRPSLSSSTLATLSRFSFAEAVLWIGAEVAAGLAHAHERGVVHRDLKPANVLLTDDGRPMLLDFNLADDAAAPDAAICGTPRYMAPEQLAALKARKGYHSARTDVYALGLILWELLAGRIPGDDGPGAAGDPVGRMLAARTRPPAWLANSRPDVSPAVKSILTKCLAPEPGDRYATAADLREDLLRQLNDQPLKFARDPSPRERSRKWARRHPRLSSATTLGAVALVALAAIVTGFMVRQRHLERLEAERARDDVAAAAVAVQWLAVPAEAPPGQYADARDRVRTAFAPFRLGDNPDWLAAEPARSLPPSDLERFQTVAQRALVFGARAAGELAGRADDSVAKRELLDEALMWNDRAARCTPGGHPVVEEQRAWLLGLAGRADEAEVTRRLAGTLPMPPDEDEFLAARRALRSDRPAEAVRLLGRLVESPTPSHSAWLALGLADLRLGRFEAAADAFGSASVLEPRAPWPYYHRGIARLELRKFADARADFDRFLELRGEEPDGYLNRAVARFRLKDYRGAVADLDRAEELSRPPRSRLYGLRAQARRLLGDAAGADRDRAIFLKTTPTDPLGWAARGEAKLAGPPADPTGALTDFEEAIKRDLDFLPALRDKGSVLSEHLGRPAEAVLVLDRVLELAPESVADRAGRAVLLARLGRGADARRDAAACATSEDPLTLYQAGCAYLLAADGPAERKPGLDLLRAALYRGAVWGKTMSTDPDLKSIHGDPAFRAMVTAAGVLSVGK
jgi:serine/threonine protein kinase/Flp pilus assembly protein TadD